MQVLHETQPNPMAMGSLEVILFGEKLATEKGILDLMDAFQRDPAIGATIQLGMVEGRQKSLSLVIMGSEAMRILLIK